MKSTTVDGNQQREIGCFCDSAPPNLGHENVTTILALPAIAAPADVLKASCGSSREHSYSTMYHIKSLHRISTKYDVQVEGMCIAVGWHHCVKVRSVALWVATTTRLIASTFLVPDLSFAMHPCAQSHACDYAGSSRMFCDGQSRSTCAASPPHGSVPSKPARAWDLHNTTSGRGTASTGSSPVALVTFPHPWANSGVPQYNRFAKFTPIAAADLLWNAAAQQLAAYAVQVGCLIAARFIITKIADVVQSHVCHAHTVSSRC